jgi:DNA-binding GntR family transcriptional regulator
VRAVLETEAARLAAGRANAESLATLRAICVTGTAMVRSGDIDGAVRANADFHRYISELSGNRFLADFAAQVDRRVRWYYTPVAPARGEGSWREHSRLIIAIKEGDQDRAAKIMREHAERTRKTYHETVAAGASTADATAEPAKAPRRRAKPAR